MGRDGDNRSNSFKGVCWSNRNEKPLKVPKREFTVATRSAEVKVGLGLSKRSNKNSLARSSGWDCTPYPCSAVFEYLCDDWASRGAILVLL